LPDNQWGNALCAGRCWYCTFSGVANCTNGIGRQTQTFLGALSRRWEELTAAAGPFTPFLAIPAPGPRTWAYDPAQLAVSQRVIPVRGGEIFELAHDAEVEFWSPPVWQQLSTQAAATAGLARRFEQVVVIAVDTPFAGTGTAYANDHSVRGPGDVKILLTLYGTAHIHHHPAADPARLAWERHALAAAQHPSVMVADIGHALTEHLIDAFELAPTSFIPWRSSLEMTADDLQPMPSGQAATVATAHKIPMDRPIVLAIARTDPTKGVDQLITALRPLRERVHLVAIVVPYGGNDPLTDAYRQQITDAGLRASYIPYFTRDLPRALASLPITRVIACPSRGEALANVPFETALWARHGGPIVVAPALGGFPEQITDGYNGLLYRPGEEGGLTAAIRKALDLDGQDRQRMCDNAYRSVSASRDVVANLAQTLRRLLPPIPPTTL
jgi:glycosyltransferase involved in cell wall biosynthesis